MPESYWRGPLAFVIFGIVLSAVAALLIWDYAAILTEQRVRYEEASRSYADQAAERIKRDCGADLAAASLRDCIRKEIEAAEDSKRAERDLDAQETMARFTRVMGYTGLIGLALGVGSVYLIWATLSETQRMAKITRDIGQKQVRAYIAVTGAELLADLEHGRMMVRIYIRNSGNSPATMVKVGVVMEMFNPRDAEANIGSLAWKAPFRNPHADIVANEVREINLRPAKLMFNRGASPRTFRLAGEVIYADVFSETGLETHTYRFAFFANENFVGVPMALEMAPAHLIRGKKHKKAKENS
ncbi:hypothetical protein GEU84_001095 [Fertoebacter nigrum]|uniref:Uncharacterized protein n=1 Tax=Fertoeibacter niger TaxID=2656921 RepID=A0A8X8H019_9RHOB|nr:hypothetical protein [Fertoeibacter niger]NUB42968.1 hypothetical protein [Fertoeibacter niger]